MLCRWPTLNCKLFFQKATVAKEERNLDKRNINSVFKNRRPRQVDSHIGRETHGRHTYTVYTHTHAQTHSREISLYEPGENTLLWQTRRRRNFQIGGGRSTVSSASHKITDDSKILSFFTSGAADSVVHKPLPHVSLTSHWHDRFVNPHTASYIRFSVIYKVRFWKELGNIFHAATHTHSLSSRLHWPTRNTFDCFFFWFCFLVFSMGCVSGSCGTLRSRQR